MTINFEKFFTAYRKQKALLSIEEAAEKAMLTESEIMQEIDAGKLEASDELGALLISSSALQAWEKGAGKGKPRRTVALADVPLDVRNFIPRYVAADETHIFQADLDEAIAAKKNYDADVKKIEKLLSDMRAIASEIAKCDPRAFSHCNHKDREAVKHFIN